MSNQKTNTAPLPYDKFSHTAIIFHWVVGLLMITVVSISYYMEYLEPSTHKYEMYNLHKSLGVLVLLFALPRILYRFIHGRPAKFDHYAKWETFLSSAVTWALYSLIFIMPISGIIMNLSGGYSLKIFNTIEIPNFIGENNSLHEMSGEVHDILGEALQILVVLHVLGTLKHFIIDKDNTLYRILPLKFLNLSQRKEK